MDHWHTRLCLLIKQLIYRTLRMYFQSNFLSLADATCSCLKVKNCILTGFFMIFFYFSKFGVSTFVNLSSISYIVLSCVEKQMFYSTYLWTPFVKNLTRLTCLTLQVCITRCTLTQVAVDLVYTGTAVLTGGTGTLVNVCKDKYVALIIRYNLTRSYMSD